MERDLEAERKAIDKITIGPINNRVDIKDITVRDVDVANIGKVLVITYAFKSSYKTADSEKEYGEVEITGEIDYLIDNPEKIQKEWKKNKKLDKQLMTEIMQVALNLSHIEAIVLSREVNLPSPIPMPRVKSD